jgi:hypothetical protein
MAIVAEAIRKSGVDIKEAIQGDLIFFFTRNEMPCRKI